MAGRAVLAVVVDPLRDPERGEHGGVERDRSVDVADREKDMIQHGARLQVIADAVRQIWT